jgi:hypothetical protein
MKKEDEKPHFILTPAGLMDCNPGGHGAEPYISSCGSKKKPIYDRTLAREKK